jgi:hypothetical protein
MGIDIRLPLGVLFLLLGAILLSYGAVSDPSLYQQSLGINVNLYWGTVLLLFGALILTLSRRGAPPELRGGSTPETPRSSGH